VEAEGVFMFEIVGANVIIREFTSFYYEKDEYFQWLRSYENIRNIYRLEYLKSLPREKVVEYAKSVIESSNDAMFAIVIKKSEKFIGTIKLGHINWRTGLADLGIMIGDAESKGHGYAKEAMKLICEYGFKHLGLRKITGGTFEDNIAMIRCFASLGFLEEGRKRKELLVDGMYIDHLLFGLFPEELRN